MCDKGRKGDGGGVGKRGARWCVSLCKLVSGGVSIGSTPLCRVIMIHGLSLWCALLGATFRLLA